MTQQFLSADVFLFWHDSARVIAIGLLGLVFVLAILQFAFSGSGGSVARVWNGRSLRTNLIISFVLVGSVPTAALGVLLAERSAHLRHDRMAEQLERSAAALATDVDHIIDMYVAGISTAASAVSESGKFDDESLSDTLLLNHKTYTRFLTMLATDRSGSVLVATSNMNGFLTIVPDLRLQSVADRPYFREPMASGTHFVSEVFRGRGLGRDPIVAISAPIRDTKNVPIGVIEGSLNLLAFHDLEQRRPGLEGATALMVDQHDRVIFASAEEGLDELESLGGNPLITSASMTTRNGSYDFLAERDGNQLRSLGAFALTDYGWKVFVRVPLDQITQQMQSDYAVSALLMLLACVLSMFAAGAIVRRISCSVNHMNEVIGGFKADGTEEKISVPGNTPREFRSLFRQMRKRAKNLRRAHKRLSQSIAAGDKFRSELTQSIAGKEAEIADRTAALEDANRKLEGLSRSDALTGIPNRREFETVRNRISRVGVRKKTPVAIVLLDIDFFKIYNDTLGHQEGDDCLIRIAQTLEGCATRPLDLVARYGGEEFVAVLGEAALADALIVALRMRNAVLNLQITHPGSCFDVVTISAGVASTIPEHAGDTEALLKAADEALYYAKAAGRNCVVYSKDNEFVTFEADEQETSATNVIQILSGSTQPRRY